MLLDSILNRWWRNEDRSKSVKKTKKSLERKPVQQQAIRLKVYTLFLEQSPLFERVYDWHDSAKGHCYARVLVQGKQILRLQVQLGWSSSPNNILGSFKGFENLPEIEYVEKVPTNNVWG